MSSNEIDSAEYRRAMGCFATGVAVVTTLDRNGARAGITINSFNSVSLEPPLVLWCIAAESRRFEIFVEAEHFAVNVLAMDQRDVCNQFASSVVDRFEGLDCDEGIAAIFWNRYPAFSRVCALHQIRRRE